MGAFCSSDHSPQEISLAAYREEEKNVILPCLGIEYHVWLIVRCVFLCRYACTVRVLCAVMVGLPGGIRKKICLM